MTPMPQTATRPQIIDNMRQHIEAGCNDVLTELPRNHYAVADKTPDKAPVKTPVKSQEAAPAVALAHPAAQSDNATAQNAQKLASATTTLDELQAALASFEGCALKQTAKNTVFSDGVPEADIMIVGEAPGQEEDRLGKPFVGKSGQLLDLMLASIGLSRKENLYIANIIAWRPPGNRAPSVEEVALCRPFIEHQIRLAQPKILLLVGGSSAKSLLNTALGITRLRGKWHDYQASESQDNEPIIPALPLLHPAYILRKPEAKADMWADLCTLKSFMEKQ